MIFKLSLGKKFNFSCHSWDKYNCGCRHATFCLRLSYFGTLQVSLLHERECVDAHRGAGFATRRSDRFLPRNGDKRRELKIIEEFHTEHRKAIAFLCIIYLCGLQLQRFCGSLERESQFLSLRCIPHCPGRACGKRFEASLQQHTCCSHCSLESLVCAADLLDSHEKHNFILSVACYTHSARLICGKHKKI